MRILSTHLQAKLAKQVKTLAMCWKLTLKSGKVMGFTNCDHDLNVDSLLYNATTGFTASALENNLNLAVDNLEIEAILDSKFITEQDIFAGLYDFAEIEVFIVDFLDISAGSILLKRGFLGEITVKNQKFIAEMRGLTQKLNQTIGNCYSLGCRANFGDQACKVNRDFYTYKGVVNEVLNMNQFTDPGRNEIKDFFKYGVVEFISGKNIGISIEVKESQSGIITTVISFPYVIMKGDQYKIIAGCDRNFNTCYSRYNNAINFRGEPHLPGFNQLLKTAGTTEF